MPYDVCISDGTARKLIAQLQEIDSDEARETIELLEEEMAFAWQRHQNPGEDVDLAA